MSSLFDKIESIGHKKGTLSKIEVRQKSKEFKYLLKK